MAWNEKIYHDADAVNEDEIRQWLESDKVKAIQDELERRVTEEELEKKNRELAIRENELQRMELEREIQRGKYEIRHDRSGDIDKSLNLTPEQMKMMEQLLKDNERIRSGDPEGDQMEVPIKMPLVGPIKMKEAKKERDAARKIVSRADVAANQMIELHAALDDTLGRSEGLTGQERGELQSMLRQVTLIRDRAIARLETAKMRLREWDDKVTKAKP